MKRKMYAVTLIATTISMLMFAGCGNQKSDISDKEIAVEVPAEKVETEEPQEKSPILSDSDLETYDKIVVELDQYMADQDFENLFSTYSTYKELYPALSEKLEEKKEQYLKQIMSMFDSWIAEADELTIAGDKVNAKQKFEDIAIILNLKDHFEELEIYHEISHDRLSYYYEYNKYTESVNLMGNELNTLNDCYYRDKDWGTVNKYADRFGNSYDEYYEMQVSSTNEDRQSPCVIFNADNQYDVFHAEFVCHDRMEEYNKFHIEVYGDDTQLYISDSFSSYNEPMKIDVEITGYKLIKFVAVREDYNILWGQGMFPSVGLYNVSFSHSGAPEFEYYIPQNQE